MSTIRDIAAQANVSVSTVSRVLNRHPHVAKQTRAKVLAIIDQNHYFSNRNAVKLSTGKTNIIGVVVPEVDHECYDAVLQGILDQAGKTDYTIMVLGSNYSERKEIGFLDLLKHKEIDGLIFVSKTISDETLQAYASFGPIANCRRNKIGNIHNVYPKRYESYETIYTWLLDKNCTDIHVTTPKSNAISQSTQEKMDAYRQVIGTDPLPYFHDDIHTYHEGLEFAASLFANHSDDMIPGFYVHSDELAVSIINAGNTFDLKANADYQLVSEGKTLLSELYHFRSVDYQLRNVGGLLFDSIFDPEFGSTAIDYRW